QPASIAYTRVEGMPMGRRHRPLVAWYGDLDFVPHFKEFVRRGTVDVTVTFGEAVPYNGNRKAVTRTIEAEVRRMMTSTLRGPAHPARFIPPPQGTLHKRKRHPTPAHFVRRPSLSRGG